MRHGISLLQSRNNQVSNGDAACGMSLDIPLIFYMSDGVDRKVYLVD